MKLTEYLDPLAYEIAFWWVGLKDPAYPIDELGDLAERLSEQLRAAAIVVLLTAADSETFLHDLVRSGEARLTYLERLARDGVAGDHHQGLGRTSAVLDTIAAGDFELVRRIGALSPPHWLRACEYEDDYWYGVALVELCATLVDVGSVGAAIDRYDLSATRADARPQLLKAILLRDQQAFDESFDELLDLRSAWIDERKRSGELEEPEVVAQRLVYVEGLALLRLAERAGIVTQPDYRFCPSIARVAMRTRPPVLG